MTAMPRHRRATLGDRIYAALEEFPGGANAYIVQDEMGAHTYMDRKRISQELARLAREQRLHRFGTRGEYIYQLPAGYLEALNDMPQPAEPRRTLTPEHPNVIAAREAADYLRPDLARRLNQLADWATGEHAS